MARDVQCVLPNQMDRSGQRELEIALENLERLSNEDQNAMRKKVYDTFSGISFLILEAKKNNFKKGRH